jgi:hypothetical protein
MCDGIPPDSVIQRPCRNFFAISILKRKIGCVKASYETLFFHSCFFLCILRHIYSCFAILFDGNQISNVFIVTFTQSYGIMHEETGMKGGWRPMGNGSPAREMRCYLQKITIVRRFTHEKNPVPAAYTGPDAVLRFRPGGSAAKTK